VQGPPLAYTTREGRSPPRARGKMPAYAQIARLKLGNVVNELHDTLGMPDLIAPPPWGIRLNQWRNIAQHYRSCVRGNLIYGYYGEPPNEQEVRFSKSELWDALQRIYAITQAVSIARSLFIIDNIKAVSQHWPQDLTLRDDAYILSLATRFATQGFRLADLQLSDDSVTATVVEMFEGPPDKRMMQASQFVYPLWCTFKRSTVIIRYVDKAGQLRLTTEANGGDCKRVADGAISFFELANLVKFQLAEAGDSKEEKISGTASP